ncbi:DUF5060 domain-containing protein [Pectobacterium wasabiae]|uniref:DUF5060 domain-containing protein n=1 Tax=Pectobacterium wasabiae TaxID=55208 RepID=A0AAW3EF62_9GAMM|nr:DUF5060 domain-containing protein [Pectobacterium wasabiae]AOR65778.1 hypothetical protein A7983_21430 [Pectobacterium wasabiae CFBP 3304]EJS94697.1 Hypothetical protein Y17_2029 [Pectobacterium wasabiae CFBP 3304]KFX05488.1 hypothetical protein JV38_12390 [Pectobacterium wasabiae]KGA30341.1 hypothetical protein KU73_00010 [Pectobacterium wasabiae]
MKAINKYKIPALKFSMVALSVLASTYVMAAESIPSTFKKWQTQDFVFETKEKVNSPFDQELIATFTSDRTGKTYVSHMFYDGESQYVSRVSLPEEGKWEYKVTGDIKDLNGRTGVITVSSASSKGKVIVDPDTKKTFKYENGDIYTPHAYELDWLFSLDKNDDSLSQTKSIISYIKDGGFNQVLMNVYGYGAIKTGGWATKDIDKRYNFNEVKEFPFMGNNAEPDYSALNVEFFKALDKKIAYLNEQNVQAHLMIYVWNKSVNWAPLGSKEDKRFFDYVIKRYSGYNNIIWDVAKEAMDYNHANAQFINDKIDRIKVLDSNKHLITLHDFIYAQSPFLAAKLDYISIQEWSPDVAKKTSDLVALHPNKPVHNIENGCYETTTHRIFNGAYNTAESCLNRNYEIYFNGAFTSHYWQNTSWFELNYEPQKLPKDKQPNMSYQKIFRAFIDKYPLTHWKPHRFNFATWSLVNDKEGIVFYLPADGDGIKGHLTPDYKDDKFEMTWFSTLTGKEYSAGIRDVRYIWIDANKPAELVGEPAILVMKKI